MKAATIKKLPLVENYYCYMYSNPCMADTDLDSYDDYVEEYIGTSPISVWNSLDTSGIISSSIPSGFSFNNWWDWQELIEEHAWNYIHNAVEEDIVTKHKGEIMSEVQLTSSLRCDLLKRRSSEIWEVKTSSYAKEPKKQLGLDQYTPKTSPSNDYAFWGTVVGIVIIGGTVVEDFLSGGIGVTDDAASFALAYKLIFG